MQQNLCVPLTLRVQERTLRLIEISGVDVNPCGGTHVASTAELQALRIVGSERARGGTRLRVLLGGRLLSALGRMLPREAALSKVWTPYKYSETLHLAQQM